MDYCRVKSAEWMPPGATGTVFISSHTSKVCSGHRDGPRTRVYRTIYVPYTRARTYIRLSTATAVGTVYRRPSLNLSRTRVHAHRRENVCRRLPGPEVRPRRGALSLMVRTWFARRTHAPHPLHPVQNIPPMCSFTASRPRVRADGAAMAPRTCAYTF